VKNTLTKIAARDAGIESFDALLEGPSAIAFVSGDPVEVAKGLRTFGREHPHLVVKGGILDGKPLTADEIRRLADLESREVLLAKLAGGFIAPAQQLVSVLVAPVRQLAQVLGALQAKAAEDPSWEKGDEGATAVEPQPDSAAEAPAEPVAEESAPAESPAAATDEAPPAAEAVAEDGAPAEAAAPATDEAAAPATDEARSAAEAPAEASADTNTDDTPTDDTTTDGVADASSDS
jgi:large subunit ribosomal protein L10